MSVSSSYLGSIQLLRFLAAVLVVIYHAIIYIGPDSGASFPETLYEYAWIGATGVHVFFIISGFIMVLTSWNAFAAKGAMRKFITRRFIRIYPIYWIVALLYILAGSLGAIPLTTDFATAIFALLLVPGYGPAIISPGWTLVYEVYFYLVFALILLLPRRSALWFLVAFFGVSVMLGAATRIDQVNALFKHMTNGLLLEFVAGAVLAACYMSGKIPEWISKPAYLASGLAVTMLLFGLAPSLKRLGVPDIAVFGVPSLLLVIVAVVADQAVAVRRAIARFAWLGDSSYAIYLVHLLVIQILLPVVQPQIAGWGSFLGATFLAIFVSVGVGLLLHIWVEAPLLIRLRRRMGREGVIGT